jgi:hypothetical protein
MLILGQAVCSSSLLNTHIQKETEVDHANTVLVIGEVYSRNGYSIRVGNDRIQIFCCYFTTCTGNENNHWVLWIINVLRKAI